MQENNDESTKLKLIEKPEGIPFCVMIDSSYSIKDEHQAAYASAALQAMEYAKREGVSNHFAAVNLEESVRCTQWFDSPNREIGKMLRIHYAGDVEEFDSTPVIDLLSEHQGQKALLIITSRYYRELSSLVLPDVKLGYIYNQGQKIAMETGSVGQDLFGAVLPPYNHEFGDVKQGLEMMCEFVDGLKFYGQTGRIDPKNLAKK